MITLTRERAIVTIALDRPAARNALPIAAWHALADAAAQAADARVVLLCSDVPGIFSAGADIAEFERLKHHPAERHAFRLAMRTGIEAIAALPMPVIAAVDGGCFGAAVALALAADLRVAGDGAGFAVTPARLGLGYPREDVQRLMRQVGQGQAARLLFTAERIDAAEAARIGLVEVPARDARAAAHAMADRIAANAPEAVALLKRVLRTPTDGAHDAAFDGCFGGAEFAEGMDAFRSRREARFA